MEQFGVINYLTYAFGALMIVLLPGPNSLYVLALSAQQGVKNGWAAAMGVFVGDSILMLLTALGAAAVLVKYPVLFMVVKYAGAAYLAYLGLRLIYSAWSNWQQTQTLELPKTLKKITAAKAFNKALLVSLINPKAILFLLSFFVQFVQPDYPTPALPFLILAITLQLFSLCYLALLIYAGNKLASAFRTRRKISAVSGGGVGVGFMAFAVKLALAGSVS